MLSLCCPPAELCCHYVGGLHFVCSWCRQTAGVQLTRGVTHAWWLAKHSRLPGPMTNRALLCGRPGYSQHWHSQESNSDSGASALPRCRTPSYSSGTGKPKFFTTITLGVECHKHSVLELEPVMRNDDSILCSTHFFFPVGTHKPEGKGKR